jgi:hypothetical protein
VPLVEGLPTGRGACTDAERRAALALHGELRWRGYEAWVETHWVRPQWAAALALGSLLAVAGSLLSTAVAVAGLVLAVAGAATMVLRPFPRRATQHVLTGIPDEGVVLAIAAAYDVPRRGTVDPRRLRGPAALICALLIVAATAARVAGFEPGWLGAVQLVPTIVLLIVLAASADIALSGWAEGDPAPPMLALDLFDELSRDPPGELRPVLLLVGAGTALPGSAARQLRSEKLGAERVVLLELVPGEETAWAARHAQVRAAAERADAALGLGAAERADAALGLGVSAGLRPPATRYPAIRISAGEKALDLALGVVDALDGELSAAGRGVRPRA